MIHNLLTNWQNFYVIIGSAAGALTGLQFVVMTLVMQAGAAKNERDLHAFGTPTVTQFCTALLISAFMAIPWTSDTALAVWLGGASVLGLVYGGRVIWHARSTDYRPDWEDRLWYNILPLLAYLLLMMAALGLRNAEQWSVDVVAGAVLLFLLTGVHNSWDSITYIAMRYAGNAAQG